MEASAITAEELMAIISSPIHSAINAELDRIEREHHVRILLACESGSRAWGFPSADSDYDVRFIYVHPRDWYLSVAQDRDVIELPIEDELDISGWDLRKALGLLRKSNPSLLEWLSSPIVYRILLPGIEPLRSLAEAAFSPATAAHHYLSMARSTIRQWSGRDAVSIKKYLYALRPVLCARWVIDRSTQPPMQFHALADAMMSGEKQRRFARELIEIKARGREMETIPRDPELEAHITEELDHVEAHLPARSDALPVQRFDEVFRSIIERSELTSQSC